MSVDVELACKCGEVHGWLRDASPANVNRIVCYCDDCQAFAHHIGRADLLDAQGGSDITQVAPSSLSFDRGHDRVTGMRLGPKGLYRFYASCCKTPLGNTLSPNLPFVGIVHELFGNVDRDAVFGPSRASLLGKFAIGSPPPNSTRLSLPFIGRTLRLMLGWKLRGRTWPHPFFDRKTREPNKPTPALSKNERDALRPLCGPR